MAFPTALTERLGIRWPIVAAPMAGGPTTPALVAAVAEAGGLAFLAGAYSAPEQIRREAETVRELTSAPFGINLFAPTPNPGTDYDATDMLALMRPIHAELGLEPPVAPDATTTDFQGQLEAALESGATAFSFTFGIPSAEALQRIRAAGMTILGTATTVEEALQLEDAGVDGIVAQGAEAGAHRGTFSGDFAAAMVGTMALVPQVVDATRVPVIASGGIMDGRGIAAAFALGASAVQMGTAFLATPESGAASAYKAAVLAAKEHETRMTRAFSGRPARGIANQFMDAVELGSTQALPYPVQNALTRAMRSAAGAQGRAEYLSLWAGQGVRLARPMPAGELIRTLAREAEEVMSRLNVRA